MTEVYSEEAAEVWLADYGFARLDRGRAWIPLDDAFAETINLQESYHVFLQSYAEAELYISRRTPTGFEVRLAHGDSTAEFSYRLVGKRKGFEGRRLRVSAAIKSPSY